MTSANSMHEAGHPKMAHWDNTEGWGWEGGGRGVQDGETHVHPWLIHFNVWQNPLQYCNQPPIKINKLFFKKDKRKIRNYKIL